MLIKCPECLLQVSDKAPLCPHCGYPLKDEVPRKRRNLESKRRRLPNGFGQISEIKGKNLRNPFRAMITIGKTDTGKPICKLLKPDAYFRTYNEAYQALINYQRNPYEVDKEITMLELYDRWSSEYYAKTESDSTIRSIKAAWKYCSDLYDMKVNDVRIRHIKGCMENGVFVIGGKERKATAHIQLRMKTVINMLLDYAVEYEIVKTNYARSFKLPSEIVKKRNRVEKEHIALTEEEVKTLWNNVCVPYVDILLIQCYSGWRPTELGLIKLEDVDLDNWTFSGGIKTDAGIDRVVPIHSKIRKLVADRYDEAVAINSKYLLNYTSSKRNAAHKLSYAKYNYVFTKIVSDLGLDPRHRPHDLRKTFITAAKKYNVDEYAIKYMVGHVIVDITEKVYTERELSWYSTEIEKIR